MPTLLPTKVWSIIPPQLELQRRLSDALGVSLFMAQLLINRGIHDREQGHRFLAHDITHMHDPFLLTDMDKAVARIHAARQRRERILIYGDYDVDGITSIAVLQRALEKMGLEVVHHIPHRIHDGYGLNRSVGKLARDKKATVFISVDCGITAVHEVEILNKAGIDVIVIDHHEPRPGMLPPALAVIDPKRHDCCYPFKDLAAVGLVMKFVQALQGCFDPDALDLVALGTIADVVPMLGENRIIVQHGLEQIAQTHNAGLAALMEITKIKGKPMHPFMVGFILGPRLNATGRMDTARRSLELLLSNDRVAALEMARALEQFNVRRQKIQRTMTEEAMDLVEREVNFKDDQVIVVSKAGWHKGVLGIVASRLAEKFWRPAVVISLEEGVGHASARSVEGFHLNEALSHCSSLLEEFGGHKLAAGLTIRAENIDLFRRQVNQFAQEVMAVQGLVPTLMVDGEIPLSATQSGLAVELNRLEPFGEGNPAPVFYTKNLRLKGRPVRRARDTLKFWVTDGQRMVPVVGFGMGKYCEALAAQQYIDIAYQLTIDHWQGVESVQLKLKDIRSSAVREEDCLSAEIEGRV